MNPEGTRNHSHKRPRKEGWFRVSISIRLHTISDGSSGLILVHDGGHRKIELLLLLGHVVYWCSGEIRLNTEGRASQTEPKNCLVLSSHTTLDATGFPKLPGSILVLKSRSGD